MTSRYFGRRKPLMLATLLVAASVSITVRATDVSNSLENGDRLDVNFGLKPKWRTKSDCGRNGLYFFLKILGNPVSFDQLASQVAVDPDRGSSLEDIVSAASKMGQDLEVVFVNPESLHSLSPPYMLHSDARLDNESGHLVVVVAQVESGVFAVLDPVDESLRTMPISHLLRHFSGYIVRQKAMLGVSYFYLVFLIVSVLLYFLLRHVISSHSSFRSILPIDLHSADRQ